MGTTNSLGYMPTSNGLFNSGQQIGAPVNSGLYGNFGANNQAYQNSLGLNFDNTYSGNPITLGGPDNGILSNPTGAAGGVPSIGGASSGGGGGAAGLLSSGLSSGAAGLLGSTVGDITNGVASAAEGDWGDASDSVANAATKALDFAIPGVGTAVKLIDSGIDAIQAHKLEKNKDEYGIKPAHASGFLNLFGKKKDKERYTNEYSKTKTKDIRSLAASDSMLMSAKGGILINPYA